MRHLSSTPAWAASALLYSTLRVCLYSLVSVIAGTSTRASTSESFKNSDHRRQYACVDYRIHPS